MGYNVVIFHMRRICSKKFIISWKIHMVLLSCSIPSLPSACSSCFPLCCAPTCWSTTRRLMKTTGGSCWQEGSGWTTRTQTPPPGSHQSHGMSCAGWMTWKGKSTDFEFSHVFALLFDRKKLTSVVASLFKQLSQYSSPSNKINVATALCFNQSW